MSAEPLLLLVGLAVALARLAASGYSTVDWLSAGVASGACSWGRAVGGLASDQAARVRDLRQCFGVMPILLDLGDSVDARAACLCAGADDFWLSSVGPSDLLQRLRLHPTGRLGQRPTLLELGDLSLDPATRQVRRAKRTVPLGQEFALLMVLMRSPGQVFSREQLLQEVWQDERASSNVVEVYVRYLRQAEADGESRLLLTVRGRGYSLGPVEGTPEHGSAGAAAARDRAMVPGGPALHRPGGGPYAAAAADRSDAAPGLAAAAGHVVSLRSPQAPAFLDVQHPCAVGHAVSAGQPCAGDCGRRSGLSEAALPQLRPGRPQ